MSQVSPPKDNPEPGSILFHDGCAACLDIARTLKETIPGLTVINLAKLRQFKPEASERGVRRLPSLVVGHKVLAIAPHAHLDDVG